MIITPMKVSIATTPSYRLEYELAMRGWTSLCVNLPIIPPHASQLPELIPIQIAEVIRSLDHI